MLQVFKQVEGSLNQFYWENIARNKAKSLTDEISTLIGQRKLVTSEEKKYITTIVCSFGEVETIANIVIDKGLFGRNKDMASLEEMTSLDLVANGVLLKKLPYLSDDANEIKSELENYFKTEGFEISHLLCGIKGEMTKSIVVFSSPEGTLTYHVYH